MKYRCFHTILCKILLKNHFDIFKYVPLHINSFLWILSKPQEKLSQKKRKNLMNVP